MLQSYAKSHIGQRQVNEDSYIIDEELGLYIIADGVGDLEKGEIASKIACNTILNAIKSGLSLNDAVYLAHRTIVGEIKEDQQKQGMATTIVAVLFDGCCYDMVWVGDSRVYIWDGALKLITKDDSYIELLLENGHIGIDDLATHPDRNVISQALGIERKSIAINSNHGTLGDNQILLLCTDGLYNIANELDIIQAIKRLDNIKDMTCSLVETAVAKDGKDNITLVLIKTASKSADNNQGIEPKVYRYFDMITGKVIADQADKPNISAQVRDQEPRQVETDPELIDQTAYKDVSPEERRMLEAAAHRTVIKPPTNKYLLPTILIIILIIVAYISLK
ncbi:MAG: serine/threonine-protein phosphatase [Alcanivoracaceae bacterium]|nr:serine/threonine-protein phosphatase [Alcanivoracaceae bacterium]